MQDRLSLIIISVYDICVRDQSLSTGLPNIGYSAGEFQALQLIVLAAFGVVD